MKTSLVLLLATLALAVSASNQPNRPRSGSSKNNNAQTSVVRPRSSTAQQNNALVTGPVPVVAPPHGDHPDYKGQPFAKIEDLDVYNSNSRLPAEVFPKEKGIPMILDALRYFQSQRPQDHPEDPYLAEDTFAKRTVADWLFDYDNGRAVPARPDQKAPAPFPILTQIRLLFNAIANKAFPGSDAVEIAKFKRLVYGYIADELTSKRVFLLSGDAKIADAVMDHIRLFDLAYKEQGEHRTSPEVRARVALLSFYLKALSTTNSLHTAVQPVAEAAYQAIGQPQENDAMYRLNNAIESELGNLTPAVKSARTKAPLKSAKR